MKYPILKKALVLFCTLALVVSMFPAAFAYGLSSEWAKTELDEMAVLGLLPEMLEEKESLLETATRLEMCAVAVQAYEIYTGQEITYADAQPFTDTDSPIAAKAYAAGLSEGYPSGKFKPEQNLTRQEFFSFVHKFLLATGWHLPDCDENTLTNFADGTSVADWARESAALVVELGIAKGSGEKLRPLDTTTCEQTLVMFLRAYLLLTEPAEPSPSEPVDPSPSEPVVPETFEEKYPSMAAWAAEELRPMDEAALIPEILIGQDMTAGITRREVCHIAVTAFYSLFPEFVPEEKDSPFEDVDEAVITQAYYLGLVSGYPNGKFKPDDPITREQFFKIVGSFLEAVGYYRIDAPSENLNRFVDAGDVQEYALPATRLLYSMGIIKGEGEHLYPQAQTQRQQALALFYRTYIVYDQWQNGYGTTPSRPVADELVAFALQYVGYSYVWGGKSPSTGFDCSGLVYYVYRHFDYPVGRTATNQWYYSDAWTVSKDEMLPGDLMFFSPSLDEDDITHVGIYVGDGKFLHAANSKRGVVVDQVSCDYVTYNLLGVKRIIP